MDEPISMKGIEDALGQGYLNGKYKDYLVKIGQEDPIPGKLYNFQLTEDGYLSNFNPNPNPVSIGMGNFGTGAAFICKPTEE